MSTHTTERKPRASNHPNARRVGPHLVVDETARVPGAHPESHLRERGQRTHAERYCRCLYCGAERLRSEDLPADCVGDGCDADSERADVAADGDAGADRDRDDGAGGDGDAGAEGGAD